jgi:hypothetical protein
MRFCSLMPSHNASDCIRASQILPRPPARVYCGLPIFSLFSSGHLLLVAHEPVPVGSSDPSLLYQLSVCHLAIGDIFRAYNYISRVPATDSPTSALFSVFAPFLLPLQRYPQFPFSFFSVARSSHCFQFYSRESDHFLAQRRLRPILTEFSRLRALHRPTFTVMDCDFHIGVISGLSGNDSSFQHAMASHSLSSLELSLPSSRPTGILRSPASVASRRALSRTSGRFF